MTRVVRGADGRSWTVRSTVNWTEPATDREFEHDVAAGQVAGIGMLVLVGALLLTVILWTPDQVVVPGWLIVAFFLVLLIFPLQWVLSRSWTIVADTLEPAETEGEHWVGTVHGALLARQEAVRVARHLQEHGVPDDGRGPLQPVN